MGRTSALIVLCTIFPIISSVGQESSIGSIGCRKNEKRLVVSPSLYSTGYFTKSFGISVGKAAAECPAGFLFRRGCSCRIGVSVPAGATRMEKRSAKLAAGCGTHGTCVGRREASPLSPNRPDKYLHFTAAVDNTGKNIPLKLYDPSLTAGKSGLYLSGLLARDNEPNMDGPDGKRMIETDVCDMPLAEFAADGKKMKINRKA